MKTLHFSTATLILLAAALIQPCAAASFQFGATGSLQVGRSLHTATLLPNGKVLVAGGSSYGDTTDAELYDRTTGIWTSTGSLATARFDHTATLLPNGKVLVAGGRAYSSPSNFIALASAELYDPVSGTWAPTGNLIT